MASEIRAAVSGTRDHNSIRTRIGGMARHAGPVGLAAVAAAGLIAACGSAGTGGGSGAGGTGIPLRSGSARWPGAPCRPVLPRPWRPAC